MTFENMEPVWDTLIADKFNGEFFDGYDKITPEMWQGLAELDSLYWFSRTSGSEEFVKIGTSNVL